MRPSRCSMSPASSSIFASSDSCCSERAASSPRRSRDAVEVDLGELAGLGRVAHEVLERVDVAELVEQRAHAVERERLVAAEAHALAPTHLRERVAQVLAELVDLPAQVHVVEQRRSASAWSCARCSGVIELSSCCICAIDCAICSSSSSSVCGLPGKKSP